MKTALTDKLFLGICGLIAAYWIIYPLFPKPDGSDAISILSVCGGIFVIWQYREGVYHILFKKERREGWIAVLGAVTVAIGIVFHAIYIYWWNQAGQPQEWVSSATSSFGRGLMGIGLFTMGISHEIRKIGAGYPASFYHAIFTAFAIVAAFIAGTHFASP